jgi:putative acetyltransferase
MHEYSPPGSVFALDQTGPQAFDICFYTAWQDGEPLGMGALKELDPSTGEIKSSSQGLGRWKAVRSRWRN